MYLCQMCTCIIVVVQVTENTASTNLSVIVLAFTVTFQTPGIHGQLHNVLTYFFLLLNFTISVVFICVDIIYIVVGERHIYVSIYVSNLFL